MTARAASDGAGDPVGAEVIRGSAKRTGTLVLRDARAMMKRGVSVVTTPDGPVAPVRWEQAIEDLDEVAIAAIVGVGPVGGQRLVAVVERTQPSGPGPAPMPLIDAVRTLVEPDVVAVLEVPAIPVDRRHNSKIDRTRLAEWASAVLAGGRVGAP